MTESLEVLLVESNPGVGRDARIELEAAGHRVHTCFEGAESSFACVGLSGSDPCPLDHRLDVALVVRHGVRRGPTPTEAGLRCAIRAGVPVVEQGNDLLDPYAPWVKARVGDDVVTACEAAASDDELIAEIRSSMSELLDAAELGIDDVGIVFERRPDLLQVHLIGDGRVSERTAQALGVRVLDVLRNSPREQYASVKVQFHPGEPATA